MYYTQTQTRTRTAIAVVLITLGIIGMAAGLILIINKASNTAYPASPPTSSVQ